MTIFIHIGLNKAGSSSIQRLCHLERALLREHRLDYPDVGIHDSAHYGISKLLINQPSQVVTADAEDLRKALRSAVASNTSILLSSEYFFLAKDDEVLRIKEFLADFDVEKKVIVYLRRHDLWIASLFNQAIKTTPVYKPWHSDIRDYTIHLLGDRSFETRYSVIVDRWAAHFGAGNLVVRPFEQAQFRMGDFSWDFLGSIDVELPALLKEQGIAPVVVNQSLPEHLLRTISYVKASSTDNKTKNAITSLLIRTDGTALAARNVRPPWDSRSFVLPPYLRKAIVDLFAEDYTYIAETYVGANDGVLFREPLN